MSTIYTPPTLAPGYSNKELVAAVLEVLEDPKRWTQGCFARDGKGRELVSAYGSTACAWCLSGAAMVVSGNFNGVLRLRFALGLGESGQCEWNDAIGRTHEEVIARLKAAL